MPDNAADIQDAYPTAVFNGINLDCLDEWVQYKGFELLAIPFETMLVS